MPKKLKNLIYIHGFSANKNDHPDLEKNARKCGYRLHSFDLPGHGYNTKVVKPDDVDFNYLVNYCVMKIKEMNLDSFVLFGHSMGGAICSVIAGGEYFDSQLKAIILESPHNVNAILRSPSSIKKAASIIKAELKERKKPEKLTYFFKELKKEKTKHLDLFANIISPNSLIKIQNSLPKIKVKVLLILANKDVYIPYKESKENFLKNVHSVKVHVIKDAGHCISIDKPREFYRVFDDFLKHIDYHG